MRTAAPLLAVAMLAACSSGGGNSGDAAFGTPAESRISIDVDNRNFDRATIWYETRAGRQRLGVVEGKTTHTFTVENWPVPAPIYLEVHLTASQTCRTDELTADPGDTLYLEIPSGTVAGRC